MENEKIRLEVYERLSAGWREEWEKISDKHQNLILAVFPELEFQVRDYKEPDKLYTIAIKMTRKSGLMDTAICGKCDGTGKLPHFSHVAQGTCFRCGGSGFAGSVRVTKKLINQLYDMQVSGKMDELKFSKVV